jgi:hypothetical protein
MIWSTTLKAVSNAFSQACLSIQLPSFLSQQIDMKGLRVSSLGRRRLLFGTCHECIICENSFLSMLLLF